VADNNTIRLDDENEPQSDISLFIPTNAGGQSTVSEDDYLTGAPELVFEVTASTRSYDLGIKKGVYEEFGALEYIVWRVQDEAIDWLLLRDGAYVRTAPDADDIFRSKIFPGLWLDWKALLTGDLARVFAVVQQGCATPEHKAFVERLAAAKE
jgi:Uma2 family endonuclease